MESYGYFEEAIDLAILKELKRKYKKQWRRKGMKRTNIIEWLMYTKYYYEIDWSIFDWVKKKVIWQLESTNDSLKKVVRQVVREES